MLGLLRQKVHPIGVDLGAGSLKMLQLSGSRERLSLLAAAQMEVPVEIHGNPPAFQEWYIETVRELLATRKFKGNRVISCLPAREMLVQHMRMAKMEEKHLEKTLPFEAQGKVPFDIHRARLRHVIAGEVYDGSETKLEIILMAASSAVVNQHLNFLERSRLEIVSIGVEPCALVNCFKHLLDRDEANKSGTMFLDLGYSVTKVVITHGPSMVFCRTLGIGADQLLRMLREKMKVDYPQAAGQLRNLNQQELEADCAVVQLGQNQSGESVATGEAASAAEGEAVGCSAAACGTMVEKQEEKCNPGQAIKPTLDTLCKDIRGCVSYHDMMFNSCPVGRVIFLGGQAKNKVLSQYLAKSIGLPAQLGDPFGRVVKDSLYGKHSDLVPDELHGEWAVAFGLSVGKID
ncbi:MAG: pilus assembly protein PilM [Sedimentisphaerales bacterium]|nr:pilus assembly protein PilM [Sedimentisphaerales bacterium]